MLITPVTGLIHDAHENSATADRSEIIGGDANVDTVVKLETVAGLALHQRPERRQALEIAARVVQHRPGLETIDRQAQNQRAFAWPQPAAGLEARRGMCPDSRGNAVLAASSAGGHPELL